MLQYSDKDIAMACILWARNINKIRPIYSKNFEKIYNIKFSDWRDAYEDLWLCSLKIPKIKRDSSYTNLNDTPSRRSKVIENIVRRKHILLKILFV